MKRLLLFLASLPLLALQNGDFSGSNYLSFTGPSINFTDYRVEFRLSGFASGGTQGIAGNNDFGGPHCLLVSGGVTLRCRDFSGAGDAVNISLSGRTDVRVRFQRFYSTGVRLLEVWDADGSDYTSASITNSSSAIPFNVTQYVGAYYGAGSQCTCVIGFARWWSTTVAQGSSAPPDALLLGYADLVDIELEGNTNDSSPNAVSVTTTGGALSYSTTTLYPPSAIISFTGAARAGSTFNLSAVASNLTTDSPPTCFWQAVNWTTAAPTFSTRTSCTATILTMPLSQTITVRIRVTDGLGQVGTEDVTLGSVATDSNSVVITSDATLARIIGVNLRSGASPWTWFDAKEKAIADALIATIPESPGDTPNAGTLTLTNGSASVTGSGTTFLSTFNCDGSDALVVLYPLAVGTGRRAYTVTACASDTAMTLAVGYDAPSSPASPSGVQYQQMTNETYAGWVNNSNNWNYYDAVAAFYRLYYRTGDTTYRDAARSLADKWWKFPYDGGRAWEYGDGTYQLNPRIAAAFGLMLRANDGKPEYWDGIMYQLTAQYAVWLNGYYPYQPNQGIGEIREQGYAFLNTKVAALLNPDSGTRATWAANSASALSYFVANQMAYGGWKFSLDPQQNYYGAGNFPWQGFALMQALRIDGSTTANAALKAYVDYLLVEGVDPANDGGFYEDSYFTWCPDYGAEKTGTVTATNGSTTVTGSSTLFQSQFACNGTDTIAIQDSTGYRRGYTVASCASQTSMTIGAAYAGATESGRRILKYAGAGTTPPSACHVSYGTSDEGKSAARTLLNAIHWGIGLMYAEYGTASYLTTGDALFAQNLGLDGPGNDGVVGHYADVVSGGTAPSYLAQTYLSKEYAFVGGAGGSQGYLAWRLGGLTPETTTSITVGVKRSAVPTATKVRVTITQPSGATATNTCSADTCTVTGLDTSQGSTALMLLEYLDAGDVVKSSGDQQLVPVV